MFRSLRIFATAGIVGLAACTNSVSPSPDSSSGGPPSTASYASGTLRPDANIGLNGSFERPSAPLGSFALFSTGMTFAHWKVIGASGNVGVVSGTFTQNGFTFPAGCGAQWLDLTGTTNTPTGVQQVLATTQG